MDLPITHRHLAGHMANREGDGHMTNHGGSTSVSTVLISSGHMVTPGPPTLQGPLSNATAPNFFLHH